MPTADGSPSNIDWRLIDARERTLEREWSSTPLVYNHAVLASISLPYRSLGNTQAFTRVSGNASLRLRAGEVLEANGSYRCAKLPYGAASRLLLLQLCSSAVKRQTPVVEVERSLTAFCRQLGLSTDWRHLQRIKEQALRLSVLHMRIDVEHPEYKDTFKGDVFSSFRVDVPASYQQETLFPSIVEFSPKFYQSLVSHAIPMPLESIASLSHSARAIDAYCWLASRLHRVQKNKPMKVRWTSLRYQFGNPEQLMKGFKSAFKVALKQALFVYPEARVEIVHGGIMLYRSPTPVKRTRAKGLLV